MESFRIDPRCWQIARLFGRNPLLRRADRIEVVVILIALVVSLCALPVAGIAGSVVYGLRHSQYEREANQRHAVVATVTATGIDRVDPSVVEASWPVASGDRHGPIELTTGAKPGQHVRIWIDETGNPADPPTPTWQALSGAAGTVLAIALVVGAGAASLVAGSRLRLDRARDAQWDYEIRCFQDDGGRANQR